MATPEEVDTTLAIEVARELGQRIYLPVINKASWRHSSLLFEAYEPGKTELINNRYGIPEPKHLPGSPIQAHKLDLICVPLVGFNANCDRIGMGAGYYDRCLSEPAYRKASSIGLAFDCQQADFEPAAHDVPMDAIITESQIYQRSR